MNQRLVGLLIVALATALPAAAQQQKGDSELQLQGSLKLATSSDFEHSGGVNVNYGRFFTDRQEWGVTVSGAFLPDGDVAGFGGPFYRYNFSSGDVVPFVGGALGASFGEGAIGDGVQLAAEGGVRFFLDRSKAFTVTGQTYYSVDNSELADTFDVLFGFSVFWGD
jgi:hypothetical protein